LPIWTGDGGLAIRLGRFAVDGINEESIVTELLGVLRKDERDLIRETEPERMVGLSEDNLLALHKRIRRARNKHVNNYRRQATEGVKKHGGRGKSRPKNKHAAQKAEVFEDALARVSVLLAELAGQAAEELKQARLAAAATPAGSAGPASAQSTESAAVGDGLARIHQKTTGDLKRDASSKAAGARRQAKRDAR
jgi:hypothetical protein